MTEQGKLWIPFQEAKDKIKEIRQRETHTTDTNQTRHYVVPTHKTLKIPNSDSNVHTTIEEPKPQRKTQVKYKESNPQMLHGQKTKFMNIYQMILPTLYNQLYHIMVNLCMQPQRVKKLIR